MNTDSWNRSEGLGANAGLDIRETPVRYQCGDMTCSGMMFSPRVDWPLPCVVLAHEWSGLNKSMMNRGLAIAALGYRCFALDVYGEGVRGDENGDNSALMNPLLADRAELRRRLAAGYETARQQAGVDPERMAAVGYCFGGLCALDLARADPPGLRAAVSFHGVLAKPKGMDEASRIGAAVLLLHGWDDPIAPPADVIAITRELSHRGATWELRAYGHALHAFTFEGANMPERGIQFQARASHESWSAMNAFLAEHLFD